MQKNPSRQAQKTQASTSPPSPGPPVPRRKAATPYGGADDYQADGRTDKPTASASRCSLSGVSLSAWHTRCPFELSASVPDPHPAVGTTGRGDASKVDGGLPLPPFLASSANQVACGGGE